MTLAFCLIKCDYQAIKNTLLGIKKIEGIVESHETNGPYDVVLKVKADSEDQLRSIVRKVGGVSGVLAILTTIVYNVR